MLPLRDCANATLTVFPLASEKAQLEVVAGQRAKEETRKLRHCHEGGPPRWSPRTEGDGGRVHRGGGKKWVTRFDFWVTEKAVYGLVPASIGRPRGELGELSPHLPEKQLPTLGIVSAPWLLHGRCTRV